MKNYQKPELILEEVVLTDVIAVSTFAVDDISEEVLEDLIGSFNW